MKPVKSMQPDFKAENHVASSIPGSRSRSTKAKIQKTPFLHSRARHKTSVQKHHVFDS